MNLKNHSRQYMFIFHPFIDPDHRNLDHICRSTLNRSVYSDILCIFFNPPHVLYFVHDKRCVVMTESNIIEYNGKAPKISELAYIDPRATVIGNVEIGDYSSLWAGVIIRGDDTKITIGNCTNIQEGTIIHSPYNFKVKIGDNVTIAHGCIIHACELESFSCVSVGGTVFDGASIGTGSIVDSRAFVPEGVRIPPRTLVHGNPGRPVRLITDNELAQVKLWAEWYVSKVKMRLKSNA